MTDAAAEVIIQALLHHHPARSSRVSVLGIDLPDTCQCDARDLRYGDRWEAHLADVAVAALTQAGLLGPLGQAPVVTRSDVTLEARWRAAALEIVTAWTVPGRMPQLHQLAREQLETHWPSLAGPIKRLVQAKAELLGERS